MEVYNTQYNTHYFSMSDNVSHMTQEELLAAHSLANYTVQDTLPVLRVLLSLPEEITRRNTIQKMKSSSDSDSSMSPPTSPGSPTNATFHPFEHIVNRKRRQRTSKVTHSTDGKICDWCQSTSTPEWRSGPSQEILCNACGLQYKKHLKSQKNKESLGVKKRTTSKKSRSGMTKSVTLANTTPVAVAPARMSINNLLN